MGKGIMESVYPILGYVLAIAMLLILATIGFMALASAAITSAATTMASILILIALLVGVGAVTQQARQSVWVGLGSIDLGTLFRDNYPKLPKTYQI